MKYDVESIKDYLKLEHPSFGKEYLIVFLFMLNFFGLLAILCDPFTSYIFYTFLPLIIFIDAWALIILCDLYKRQVQYILFVGVFCFIMSLIFMMFSFKIVYLILRINSPIFALYAVSIYILILLGGFAFHVSALQKGYYNLKNMKKGSIGIKFIVISSVIGTIAGKFLIKNTSEQTAFVIFSLASLLLAYILELGVNNIHKYCLIKRYKEYVNIYPKPKKNK